MSRRKFVAGAGAAAVVAAKASPARAAGAGPVYRIHPAIGVARVGNADSSTYFIGPEAPGYGPLGQAPGTVAPPYKTPDGKVKPQGARFRIYEYGDVGGRLTPIREVTLDTPGVVAIRWTVHLANKKASFKQFAGLNGETSAPAGNRNATVTNRNSLNIDFGPRTINGRAQGPVTFVPSVPPQESCPLRDANQQPVIGYLGEVRTDAQGRLIVIGGKGMAGYKTATAPALPSYANNDGWFDDVSDGPVTAIVTIDDGTGTLLDVAMDAAGGAWVLCAPPDFAPRITGSVSGYELLYDLAVRSIAIPPTNALYDDGGPLEKVRRLKADYTPGADFEFPTSVPDFTTDIQPILLTAYNTWYVDALVPSRHNSLLDPNLGNPSTAYTSLRTDVFGYMRGPAGVNPGPGRHSMPKTLGDDPYTSGMPESIKHLPMTHVQFGLLRRWASNAFTPPTGAPPPEPTITPHGLDQAALENCSGGAFFPGIEIGWQIRNPSLFIEPFRLNLQARSGYVGEAGAPIGPGHFSRQMAVPWHADFNDCRNEGTYAWWPHQRPTDVLASASATKRVEWARATSRWAGRTSSHSDMVANWYKFGFVLQEGNLFVEKERAAKIP